MHIRFNTAITFERRLHSSEEAEFLDVLKSSKQKLGNNGNSILILPTSSLPQNVQEMSGVGNFLNKEGTNFIDFAKQYWGINCIQTLPNGRFPDFEKGGYKPYAGTNFALGEQLICLESLSNEEYGKLLNTEDLKQIYEANTFVNKDFRVNYENVLDKNSKTNEKLKKAFEELKKADTDIKKQMLEEFKTYKINNKEWLEPMSIYEALSVKYGDADCKNWNHFDKNLYNLDVINLSKREKAIKGLRLSEFGKEAEFFEFKQFIAEKHLEKARSILNKKGVKLSGDMCSGFSKSEVWANPKAFLKDSTFGWNLPALDLDAKEGQNLLRKKVNIYAKRYDSLRVDASWSYISPKIKNKKTGLITHKNYGDKILNLIDDEVRAVKGVAFDKSDIMHEFVADLETFNIYENTQIKPFIKERNKIYTTEAMHKDWGSVDNFIKRGWQNGEFVIGTTNHDSLPMRIQFADTASREVQTSVLSDLLKIPKSKLESLDEFIKAKFAEPMRSKHNMIFYIDALNLEGKYKETGNIVEDYRLKINSNYQDDFFKSLEKGKGFNIMDSLEKAFVAEGLDKTEKALYDKIVRFKKILQAPSGAKISSGGDKGAKMAILIGLAIGIVAGLLTSLYRNRAGKTDSQKNV